MHRSRIPARPADRNGSEENDVEIGVPGQEKSNPLGFFTSRDGITTDFGNTGEIYCGDL